jgi:hypothetical protein
VLCSGDIYQEHALDKLAAGGDFDTFKLLPKGSSETSVEVKIHLEKSRVKLFDATAALAEARSGGHY